MQQPSFEPYASPSADASPPPGESIRFGEALKFCFRAEKPWMNILVSSLMAFIPIAGPIAIGGWHAEIMQRLVRRHPTPIPTFAFDDFTHYLTRGVQPFVMRVIVSLPFTMFIVIGSMIGGASASFMARSGDPTAMFVVWGIIAGVMVLSAPIMAIVTSAVYTRADLVEEFGAAMQPRKLMKYMGATWLGVLGTSIVFGLLSLVMVLVGVLACYVGAFIASAIVQLGQLHLRWQIYERYVARGGEPIPVKAAVMLPSEQARVNPYAPYGGGAGPYQGAPPGYPPGQPPPPPPPPQYPPR